MVLSTQTIGPVDWITHAHTNICSKLVHIATALQHCHLNSTELCSDAPCSKVMRLKWFQLNRVPFKAKRKCTKRECGGTAAREVTARPKEGGRLPLVSLSAQSCLFTCHVCSGLVFRCWHAALLSCSSQYSCGVITWLAVLPSPWP